MTSDGVWVEMAPTDNWQELVRRIKAGGGCLGFPSFIFSLLSSKHSFSLRLCVCVRACACVFSLSLLSLVSGSIFLCVFLLEFFFLGADLQVLSLCGACVYVGGEMLACSLTFVFVCVSVYMCVCVCVSVCPFSLGLQWKSVNLDFPLSFSLF